jgi:hypothetical protein
MIPISDCHTVTTKSVRIGLQPQSCSVHWQRKTHAGYISVVATPRVTANRGEGEREVRGKGGGGSEK